MVNELEVRVERDELTPIRAHPTDAGLDLRSKIECVLSRGNRTLVGTGVQVKVPVGYVGFLIPRSSLSKKGIIMLNSIGVIDADYRGEIMACLQYTGTQDWVVIDKNERVVQLVIVPTALVDVLPRYVSEEEWNDTERGTSGFGSTGKQ